jgi:hypothetical protein
VERVAKMFDRTLRRYCESVVEPIPLPRPFSARVLCEELAARRGRRIYLHPFDADMVGEGMPCGMWVATRAADHVFFERNTSQYHQDHIILHELGHMLCQHGLGDVDESLLDDADGVVGGGLLDGGLLEGDVVHGALMRTSYSTRQEREAELVATMILERAMAWDGDGGDDERYFGEVLGFL